jgi:alkylation response protein AidB-like acyl-CoA dehydrogenase
MSLENEAYRRRVRDFLATQVPEGFLADQPDHAPPGLEACKAWEAAMHRAGLAGITWPEAYGGHGLTLREHLIANQEIGRLALPESVNSIGKELAGPIILAIGTEDQKRRYLPAILEMREIWCQGFSEPEAGSDLAGLRTRAVRDGDGWRITGQKIWTSGAPRAQRCLLLARTGSVEDRHRGLALFAVRMDSPGLRVRSPARSEPASGSEKPWHQISRISRMAGR